MRLLERDRELREASARLDGPGRSVVLLTGVPGIGKSALLRALVERRPETVLTVTGSPVGVGAPFDALRRLFGPWARLTPKGAAPFDGPGDALRRMVLGEEVPADAAAVVYAVHWVLGSLAEGDGVLLAVDDAQWLDDASGQVLAAALAQTVDERVRMIAALREVAAESRTAFDRDLRAVADAIVTPRALSVDAVARLLGPRAEDAARVHEMSGGIPFYVEELAGALAGHGEPGSPARVAESVRARLERLGADAVAVARAVAVLGPEARPATVSRLTGIAPGGLDVAVRALVADGILAATGPDGTLVVAHPLVGEAVLAGLGRVALHESRSRAARLLHDDGVPHGRVAGVLLLDEPSGEPWRAAVLLAAAASALGGGAAGAAIGLLDRAAQESPDAAQSATLGALRATALLAVGRAGEAAEELERGLPALGHLERARRLMDVGDARYAGATYTAAERAYRSALAALDDAGVSATDPLRVEAVARFAIGRLTVKPLAEVVPAVLLSDVLARPAAEDGREHRRLLAAAALSAHSREEWDRAPAHLADRALGGGSFVGDGFADDPVTYLLSGALYLGERFGAATELLDHAIDDARRRGRVTSEMSARFTRGAIRIVGGDLTGGLGDLEASAGLGRLSGAPHLYYVSASALLVRYSLVAGDHDRAETVVGGLSTEHLLDSHVAIVHLARAEHALRTGDPARALELAERARALDDDGIAAWTFSWRTVAAEAALDLGDRDRAAEVNADELAILERRRIPRAARLDAVLLAARLAEDAAASRRVLAGYLDSLPERHAWQRATVAERIAALDAGEGREADAVASLLEVLRVAERHGLAGLESRVRAALRTRGREPVPTGADRRLATLTPAESRVAVRAGAGRSNRAIAQELFVTLKTVEFHLARVYRKLGIASRGELAAVYAEARRERPVA